MNLLPYLLVQSGPPPQDPTGSAWILTQGIMAMAGKIDAAISPASIGFGGLLATGFFLITFIMIMTLLYDASKVVREALSTGNAPNFYHALLDSRLIRKYIRFAICLMLGGAAYMKFYLPNDPASYSPLGITFAQYDEINQNILDKLAGGDNIGRPMEQLTALGTTVRNASREFGAYAVTRALQVKIAQEQAIAAARLYWVEMNPEEKAVGDWGDGATSTPGGETASEEGVLDKLKEMVDTLIRQISGLPMYLMSLGLVLANFGMDVFASRVLMLNGLYLMMAAKLMWYFLPVAALLAYWPHHSHYLSGCIRTLIITTITLTVMTSAAGLILNKDSVAQMATAASNVSANTSPGVQTYVKKIYAEMALTTPGFTPDTYYKAVADGMNKTSNLLLLDMSALFWMPLYVMFALTLVIGFLGRLGRIIGDAVNGSLGWIRGGM